MDVKTTILIQGVTCAATVALVGLGKLLSYF